MPSKLSRTRQSGFALVGHRPAISLAGATSSILSEMNLYLYGCRVRRSQFGPSSRYKVIGVSVGLSERRPSANLNCSLLLANRFVSSRRADGRFISSFGPVCLLRVNRIQNTPVGFGIGSTKIGSRDRHLHAFGEAFVVEAHTLQTSAPTSNRLLDRFERSDKWAQLTSQQWQMIKTLISKVLSAAVQ